MEILLQTIKMQRDRKIPLPDISIITREDSHVSAMKVPKKCHIYVGLGGLMPPVKAGTGGVSYLLNTFDSNRDDVMTAIEGCPVSAIREEE